MYVDTTSIISPPLFLTLPSLGLSSILAREQEASAEVKGECTTPEKFLNSQSKENSQIKENY